jgi:hypothetical protein
LIIIFQPSFKTFHIIIYINMISYSKYKLLKEDAAPSPSPGGPPTGGPGGPTGGPGGGPPTGGPSEPMPPPGFGGGGGMSMAGGMGGPGGGPEMGGGSVGSAADLKPSGLKSSNVWDVLEKLIKDNQK